MSWLTHYITHRSAAYVTLLSELDLMNSSSSNTTLCLFTYHDVLDKSCYLGHSDQELTLPILKSVMPAAAAAAAAAKSL